MKEGRPCCIAGDGPRDRERVLQHKGEKRKDFGRLKLDGLASTESSDYLCRGVTALRPSGTRPRKKNPNQPVDPVGIGPKCRQAVPSRDDAFVFGMVRGSCCWA